MKHTYFLDGKAVASEIALHFFEPATTAVFETLRVYNAQIFREAEHLERLRESAQTAGLAQALDLNEARRQIRAAVKGYGQAEATLRVTWNPGLGYLVMIGERKLSQEVYAAGITLQTSAVRRSLSNASPPEAKTSDYMNAVLATLEPFCHSEAGQRPAEESLRSFASLRMTSPREWIFLDRNGYVTEVRTGNLFIVDFCAKKPRLRTPPLEGILNGVTRRFVIECALLKKLEVKEEPLTRHEIYNASEAFLTNTSWEILPVRSLDGRTVGRAVPGKYTRELHKVFRQRVMRECPPQKSKER